MKWTVPLLRPSGGVSQGAAAMGALRVYKTVTVEADSREAAVHRALRENNEAHAADTGRVALAQEAIGT